MEILYIVQELEKEVDADELTVLVDLSSKGLEEIGIAALKSRLEVGIEWQ